MNKIEIKGLTDEQNAGFQKAFDALSESMQNAVAEKIKGLAGLDALNEIKGLLQTAEGKDKFAEIQKSVDDLAIKLKNAEGIKTKEDKTLSLSESIKELFASDEFKKAKADNFRNVKSFELKADTSDITGTVNMTVQRLQVGFAPEREMAFLPNLNTGTIGQDKNRVLWVEGAYTSNVGYVGEGTGQATADSGTAAEKSRAMAKISAKLPLTAELLEDADYIASAFRMKMQEKAMLFADGEFYTGDGSDGVNPNHIYGIVGQSTAFNAATAGIATSVVEANIGDLIDGCVLQAAKAEQRGLNVVWMNPSDFYKMKKTKASDGQYLFVKDVNGNYTINGLRVITSNYVTANTLTVANTSKIQAWWKRRPEVKFSQMNSTDFVDDAYTAVLFLRTQCIVEAQDQTALIHVSDIAAAVTAITAV